MPDSIDIATTNECLETLLNFVPLSLAWLAANQPGVHVPLLWKELNDLRLNVQYLTKFAAACKLRRYRQTGARQHAMNMIAEIESLSLQLSPILSGLVIVGKVSEAAVLPAIEISEVRTIRDSYSTILANARELMSLVHPRLVFEFSPSTG